MLLSAVGCIGMLVTGTFEGFFAASIVYGTGIGMFSQVNCEEGYRFARICRLDLRFLSIADDIIDMI